MSKEKKEAARRCRALWQSISEGKGTLRRQLREYKSASSALSAYLETYNKADIRYMKKGNAKTERERESAVELLSLGYAEFKSSRDALLACCGDIRKRYARLVSAAADVSDREWNRAISAAESFERDTEMKMRHADKGVGDHLPDFLREKRNAPASEPAHEPTPAPTPALTADEPRPAELRDGARGVALDTDFLVKNQQGHKLSSADRQSSGLGMNAIGVTSVNIAPINIDVSSIVTKAVSATVAKLQASLDGKLSAYVDSLNITVPADRASAPAPDTAIAEGPAAEERERALALAREEAQIYSELQAISSALSELRAQLAEINEEFARMAEVQSAVAEGQKQTAETQKKITEAQSEAAEAQKKITEVQAEAAQTQKKITEAQSEAAEAQAGIAENQKKIALEQKETADLQKKTVRLQQGIRISQRLLSEDEGQGKLLVKKEEPADSE